MADNFNEDLKDFDIFLLHVLKSCAICLICLLKYVSIYTDYPVHTIVVVVGDVEGGEKKNSFCAN